MNLIHIGLISQIKKKQKTLKVTLSPVICNFKQTWQVTSFKISDVLSLPQVVNMHLTVFPQQIP